MTFDVVIPSNRPFSEITQLLASLTDLKRVGLAQCIIVFNPSNSVLSEELIVEKDFKIIQLHEKKASVNRARNAGLLYSKSDFVLFLDSDCVVESVDSIQKMILAITNNENYLAVGGYYRAHKSELTYFQRIYFLTQNHWVNSGETDKHLAKYLLGGFFMLNRKKAIEHNLLFDDKMIFGGTEKEFFLRAGASGFTFKLLDIVVLHIYDQSAWQYLLKVYKQGRGHRYIEKKLQVSKNYTSEEKKIREYFVFKYIFWMGYYFYDGRYLAYLYFILNNIFSYFNNVRYKWLDKIKKDLEKMNE